MHKKGKSIWEDTVTLPHFPKLEQDIKVDVVVIGGGLCGILTAYQLTQEGLDVVVVEKNRIASGITKNTTAVITAQHDVLYRDRIQKEGFEKAKLYVEANLKALDAYQKLSESYDFDFEEKPSYIYSTQDEKRIQEEVEALQQLGINAELVHQIDLPFDIQAAVCFPHQAQMNPLLLIQHLIKHLRIFEDTEVIKVSKHKVTTTHHSIFAKQIIITTHYPFINRLGLYYAKLFQNRSYVIAVKTKDNIHGTYIDLETGGLYFRNYQDYLLIGGNDRPTADKGCCFHNLIHFAKKHYPDCSIDYEWGNQDCMTLDDRPYIGTYSTLYQHIYVATGFNLWGMTQSMIAAQLLTDLILERENPYQALYNPHRNMIQKQLFINLGNYAKHVLKWRKKRCPHLGSELVWNEEEQSWDCPCHGSRFDESGDIIDNPAVKPLDV